MKQMYEKIKKKVWPLLCCGCLALTLLFAGLWLAARTDLAAKAAEAEQIRTDTASGSEKLAALEEERAQMVSDLAALSEEKAALQLSFTELEAINGELAKKFSAWSRPG